MIIKALCSMGPGCLEGDVGGLVYEEMSSDGTQEENLFCYSSCLLERHSQISSDLAGLL